MGGASPQVERVLGALEGLSADQARATLQAALAKIEPVAPVAVAPSAPIPDEFDAVPTSPHGRQVVTAAPQNRQQRLILGVLAVLCVLSGGVLVMLVQHARSDDSEALMAPPPPRAGAEAGQAWSNDEDELPSLSRRHAHAVTARPAARAARPEAEPKPKTVAATSAPRPREAAPATAAATPAAAPATQSGDFEDEDLKAMRH